MGFLKKVLITLKIKCPPKKVGVGVWGGGGGFLTPLICRDILSLIVDLSWVGPLVGQLVVCTVDLSGHIVPSPLLFTLTVSRPSAQPPVISDNSHWEMRT